MSEAVDPKHVAQSVVEQFAPAEAPSFELVWENLEVRDLRSSGPTQFLSELGNNPMFAAIIAPIALEVAKHLAAKAADALIAMAKGYLEKYKGRNEALADDERIARVAKAIVEAFGKAS